MRRWIRRAITRLPWLSQGRPFGSGALGAMPRLQMTYEQALAIPAMDCGVKAIAQAFASLPLRVMDRDGKEVEDHFLTQIFNRSPSEFINAYDYKSTAVLHLIMFGHHYAERVKLGARVVGLELRLPDQTFLQPFGGELRWKTNVIAPGGKAYTARTLTADEIFRVTALSYDTFYAIPIFQKFADTFGLSQEAVKYALGFFLNSGRPSGVLMTEREYMTADEMSDMASGFARSQTGKNAQRPAVTYGGVKYVPTQTMPNESQFIEARYSVIEDVARILDISPVRLHHLLRSTYNNTRQEALNFSNNTIAPWAARFEAAIDSQLLTDAEKRLGYHCSFNIDVLRVESREDRYRAYRIALGSPAWLTPDEVRAAEGMESMEVAVQEDSLVDNDDSDSDEQEDSDDDSDSDEQGDSDDAE